LPVLFELVTRDISPSLFNIETLEGEIFDLKAMNSMVVMTSELCRKFHIPEENIKITIENLVSSSKSADFCILHYVLCERDRLDTSFLSKVDNKGKHQRTAVVCLAKTQIGNYAIACCLGIVEDFSSVGNQEVFNSTRFFSGPSIY
jgi:hypothetical protein